MAQFYPAANFDGPFLYAIRLVGRSAMVLFLCLDIAAIVRRDIARYRNWMMRGYTLGIGAGTQVLTHLPWFLFPSRHNIDKHFDPPPSTPISQYKPFSEIGAKIDAGILKAAFTRHKENDMAWGDEYSLCPQGQIGACSITTGCECKEK